MVITRRTFDPCGDCAAGEHHGKLGRIGESISHPSGNMATVYTYYQCKVCGKLWLNSEDRGQGGYDTQWERLKV
jgi:hypothetical protein